eukprot:3935172-Rhodomonas_salina.1
MCPYPENHRPGLTPLEEVQTLARVLKESPRSIGAMGRFFICRSSSDRAWRQQGDGEASKKVAEAQLVLPRLTALRVGVADVVVALHHAQPQRLAKARRSVHDTAVTCIQIPE